MLYDELLQEFAYKRALPQERAKQIFDNLLTHLKNLKERDDLHYADYVLVMQDLGLNDYGYIQRLITLIEPER